jgi:hypothetical protein
VVSLMLGLFLNSSVLVEERAVEAELARGRAYWAQMGALNYALSRISYSQLCDAILCLGGNIKDSDLAPVLAAYLYELNNNRTWTYADEAAGYSFTLTATASPDDTAGRQTYSGWLMATTGISASTLLASSAGTLPRLELRLCVGRPSGASCGFLSINNGGNATKYFSINRLTTL